MQKSMDLFGQALSDRYNGETHPLYIEVGGESQEHNLDRYFRTTKDLSKIEKTLISKCYGNILDVGCGTGNYIPAMEKMGKVIGIDISPIVIKLANTMGIKNCFVADIFTMKIKDKFDTITMLENNLGMGETITGTKKLLRKLSSLLKRNGQILTILSGRAKDKDYLETTLTPIYKNVRGESFSWINFNYRFLAKLCEGLSMNLEVISGNQYYTLVKITRS